MKKKIKLMSVLVFAMSLNVFGQDQVAVKNQHLKKRVVRAIDLREKQNKPLYARNMDFSALLIEALEAGEIKAYTNDSLVNELDYKSVQEKLLISSFSASDGRDYNEFDFDTIQDDIAENFYFEGRDLYQLEMTQDWVFDKEKSVVNKQNVSITLFIPADHADNVRGFQIPIATFSFTDCQKLWKDNPRAIWFNPANDAAHLNLSDALRLELYHSYLIKVSNPDDAEIADGLTGKQGIIESGRREFELAEYESNLWEN